MARGDRGGGLQVVVALARRDGSAVKESAVGKSFFFRAARALRGHFRRQPTPPPSFPLSQSVPSAFAFAAFLSGETSLWGKSVRGIRYVLFIE